MKKKWFSKITVVLSLMMLLTACGGGNAGNNAKNNTSGNKNVGKVATGAEISKKHPAKIENDGEVVDDTILKAAYVSDSGFKGIFNGFLYSDGIDNAFLKYTMDGAFPTDSEFKLILDSDETPINIHIDPEEKVVTYKINPKFKWDDGTQVTTADIVKTYEIVANREYIIAAQSPRFGEEMHAIKGIVDYNEGKADHIEGLEVIDDNTMKIHLTDINPGVYYGEGVFCGEFVKASALEGVPMDKVQESDAIRKNPPSYGPYVMKEILSGERVVYEANEHYYKGAPKIKKIEMEILPPSQQVAAIEAGKYDIVIGTSADVFPQLEELNNISLLTRPDLYMSYMGFKQGKWDAATGTNITDPDAKMNDVNLKKAMAYAIDNDAIGEKYQHGLRFTAESPLPPIFGSLKSPKVEGYHMDLDKANKLLDEGGYEDIDGDGIREDKDGNQLVINFAMMSGGEIQEPLSQYYMQQWEKIGLKTELVDGRLLEFNNFYDRVQKDDPAIDVFMAAFGLSSNPNPTGLYGERESFNYSRYTSPELQEALDNLSSPEAMDPEKASEFYRHFDEVFYEEAPQIPMQNKVDVLVINNRVKSYDWNWGADEAEWANIELTANEPIANK